MKYNIGVNRNVTVEIEDGELFVTIAEENSSKSVTFPAYRWAQFVAYQTEIDESVKQLVDKQGNVKLFVHVGGAWYVSVTTGFACVDIRLFYNHPKFGERRRPALHFESRSGMLCGICSIAFTTTTQP
jgi:hypothetical protein